MKTVSQKTVPLAEKTKNGQAPWSAQRLYRPYVRWAIAIGLTLGFTTGAAMLLLPALGISAGATWLTHTQAHGMAQLFGWAGLFVMGVAFHVVPRFRSVTPGYPWPQRAALVLVLLGIILRFTGQVLPSPASPAVLVASGVLLLAGVAVFAFALGRTLRQGTPSINQPERWFWAGIAWALAATALHMGIVVQMASTTGAFAPPSWNTAYVHAATLGFIGNFIFGVSARALPAFMSLSASHARLRAVAFGVVNLGVTIQVAAALAGTPEVWASGGPILTAAGVILFVLALRVFERRTTDRPYIPGTYARYEWFVRAAYGWLLAAGALAAWEALGAIWAPAATPVGIGAPVLHILALGFVTMMIMGMASRMLPMFEGGELRWHAAMDFAFVTLNLSVLLRLAFGLIPSDHTWAGLAVSGVLGLLALVAFGAVAWSAMLPSAREHYQQAMQVMVKQRMGHRGTQLGAQAPGQHGSVHKSTE
ncbi:MAG: NnrS family protein [Dehalococcoidia bacterium]